ncbi:hypothetical protein EMCRGX_G021677 [Ephydatia muelleri]
MPLDCKKGGHVTQRHNEVRDALGDLAAIAYKDVVREPIVQDADDANGRPTLIADLSIRGVWQPQTVALLDVRVIDTNAQSYASHTATLEHVSSAQGRAALFTTLLRQASASGAGVLGAKIQSLENMLGSTPERGHAFTAAHNGQFFMLEQCLIPMDAHLNLGKFLYEEIPAWKKYQQQCLIPMDAHLNLGKFLYEEIPAWKKYQQQCLISMDAHLNLGKFLYEETPAWKKYQPLGVLGKQSDQDVIEECLEQLEDEVERLCNEEQVTAADQLFSKMAVSKVSLQLAIYYACLQIYARTAESSNGEPLLCPPATLMSLVISLCPPAY